MCEKCKETVSRVVSYQLTHPGGMQHEDVLIEYLDRTCYRQRLGQFCLEVWHHRQTVEAPEEIAILIGCDPEKVVKAMGELGLL